jgi:hypothetical protein
VTVTPDQPIVTAQFTEDRHADVVECVAQHRRVAIGTDPVQHDAGDAHRTVERREPVHQRGDRARHRGGIDDQNDRRLEQPGHVGGRGSNTVGCPVEQSHHSLDDQDVAARCRASGERRDRLGAAHPRIEVAGAAPGRRRVIAGIDEVGTHLCRGRPVTGIDERAQQAGRHRRLADPRMRAGDDEAGTEHRHVPRLPR